MSGELEAAKEVVAHPASWVTALTGLVGWLGNKLWRGFRHEIADIKQSQTSSNDAIWEELKDRRRVEAKLFDLMREHEGQDRDRFDKQEESNRDRHDEIMQVIGDLRTDVAGLKR